MSVLQRLVTAEALLEMSDVSGMNHELVAGKVVEMAPAGFEHNQIAGLLYRALWRHVEIERLGIVAGDNLGYVLGRDPDTVRAPDVSFLARDRVPTGSARQRYVEGPPTVAVEVVSPNDRADDIHDKVQEYLQAGTRQVWMLWSRSRSISVHRPDADTRELGPDATLDGGAEVPGFSVRVGDVFEVE